MKRVLVVALIIGLVTATTFWIRRAKQDVEWEETHQDVLGILTDLANHNATHDRLPPTVFTSLENKPLYSWRFATASMLLSDPVQFGYYGQVADLSKPWDSTENRRYVTGPYREYSGSPSSYIDQNRQGNKARFVAVTGPDTAFENGKSWNLNQLPPSLILVVETRGCMVHWMQPGGDIDVRTMPTGVGEVGGIGPVSKNHQELFVGFVDGEVRLLHAHIPLQELQKFLTIKDAAQHDRGTVLGPYSVRVWKNPHSE